MHASGSADISCRKRELVDCSNLFSCTYDVSGSITPAPQLSKLATTKKPLPVPSPSRRLGVKPTVTSRHKYGLPDTSATAMHPQSAPRHTASNALDWRCGRLHVQNGALLCLEETGMGLCPLRCLAKPPPALGPPQGVLSRAPPPGGW